MNRLQRLETARVLARQALKGLVDKAGEPAFEHARRVAARQTDPEAAAVGWLHDLVEDAGVTLREIEDVFGDDLARDVDALTRRPRETYRSYVARVKGAGRPRAVAVKLADVDDHLDPVRVGHIPESLADRYRRARAFLAGETSEADYLGAGENAPSAKAADTFPKGKESP